MFNKKKQAPKPVPAPVDLQYYVTPSLGKGFATLEEATAYASQEARGRYLEYTMHYLRPTPQYVVQPLGRVEASDETKVTLL